jgi:hypothetical protein
VSGRDDERDPRRDDEADLRAAFAGMRREDAAGAPAFEAVVTAASRGVAKRRRPWLVPTLTGTVAAAALAVAVTAVLRRPEPRIPATRTIEEWIAPTDFLLETPGRELLETVPEIGALPAIGADEALPATASPGTKRSMSP